MKSSPLLPGLALTALGLGMLGYHALSIGQVDAEAAALSGTLTSLATIPVPLAVGWTILSGGLAWLVARPRGDRV